MADSAGWRIPPDEPFPGIDPYEPRHAPVFFGRDAECRELFRLVVIHRGVLLFAPSGTGKSSLVRAGLVPEIVRRGFLPVDVRVQPEPGHEITARVLRPQEETLLDETGARVRDRQVFSVETFSEAVRRRAASERVLLIFDQFEEWVTLFDADGEPAHGARLRASQDRIRDLLVKLLHEGTLPIKLLLVFREDYLAGLTPILGLYPAIRDQYLRLGALSGDRVVDAIRGPFERFPELYRPEIDPGLARRIRDDLQRRSPRGEANLTEVQIVCWSLWQASRRGGDPATAFAAAGGVTGILEHYLEKTLTSLPTEQQEPAIGLLRRLVTSKGTRNVIARESLLKLVGSEDGEPLERLAPALDRLERSARMVRRERRREVDYYEITSEFLVPWILRRGEEHELEIERRNRRRAQARLRRLRVGAAILVALLAVAAALAARLEIVGDDLEEALEKGKAALTHARHQATLADLQRLRAAAREAEDDPRQSLAPLRELHRRLPASLVLTPEDVKEFRDDLESTLRDALARAPKITTEWALPGDLSPEISAVSPDGRFLLAAGTASGLWMMDLSVDEGAARRISEARRYSAVTVGGAGGWIAAAEMSGAVHLWRLGPGEPPPGGAPFATIPAPDDVASNRVRDLEIDADGTRLVIARTEGDIAVHEIESTALVARLCCHRPWLHSVSLDSSGRFLASGGADRRLRLWDIASRRQIAGAATRHKASVRRVVWGSNGLIATASFDRTSQIARGGASGTTDLQLLAGHQEPVSDVVFSPDQQLVVTSSLDGSIRIWSTANGSVLAVLQAGFGPLARLFWTGDGARPSIVAVGFDRRVRRIALPAEARGIPIGKHLGHVYRSVPSPDGSMILSVGQGGAPATRRASDPHLGEGQIVLFGRRTGSWEKVADLRNRHGAPVRDAAWCPSPHRFVTIGGRQALFWALTSGDDGEISVDAVGEPIPVEPGSQVGVDCDSTGDRLLVLGGQGAVTIHALGSRDEPIAIAPPAVTTRAIFADSGGRILTGDADGLVRLWTSEGKAAGTFEGLGSAVHALDYDPIHGRIAAGDNDGSVAVWNAASMRLLSLQSAHGLGRVYSVAFGPDGKLLLTAGQDASVKVWEVSPWRAVSIYRDQPDVVFDATFTADSTQILTSGGDRTVRTYSCRLCGSLDELIGLAEEFPRVGGSAGAQPPRTAR